MYHFAYLGSIIHGEVSRCVLCDKAPNSRTHQTGRRLRPRPTYIMRSHGRPRRLPHHGQGETLGVLDSAPYEVQHHRHAARDTQL